MLAWIGTERGVQRGRPEPDVSAAQRHWPRRSSRPRCSPRLPPRAARPRGSSPAPRRATPPSRPASTASTTRATSWRTAR